MVIAAVCKTLATVCISSLHPHYNTDVHNNHLILRRTEFGRATRFSKLTQLGRLAAFGVRGGGVRRVREVIPVGVPGREGSLAEVDRSCQGTASEKARWRLASWGSAGAGWSVGSPGEWVGG